MKTKLAIGLVAAAMSTAAVAEKPWRVSVLGGIVFTDSSSFFTGPSGYVSVGRRLDAAHKWELELGFFTSTVDVENDVEWKKAGAGLSLLYHFDKKGKWHSYAIGAVNAMNSEIGVSDETSAGTDIGLGILRKFESFPLDFRAETRYRLDFHGDNSNVNGDVFYDWTVHAGFAYPFGGETAPEAPVFPSVYFALDSARLTARGKSQLDGVVRVLEENPDMTVNLAGHADDTGPVRYNQRLSERRARSVKKYLTAQGVSARRINSEGFGEGAPVADNRTAVGRKQNRRVELSIGE